MTMHKPKSVEGYILAAPIALRTRLRALRAAIKRIAPKAEEKLSYGMPYYGYHGRLAYFSYFKNHIGLYVPPPVVADHKKELKEYATAMATVRFPNDKSLPIPLIKKLIKARMKINEAQAKRICSRGHSFLATGPCPKCWPGRLKKRKS